MADIYRTSLAVLRHSPWPTVGIVAISLTILAALGVLARMPLVHEARWTPGADRDVRQVLVTLGFYPAGTMLVTLVWMMVSVGATAIGSVAAYRYLAGERTSLRSAWARARPRFVAALGLGALDVVVVLAPILIAGAAAIALAVRTGPETARVTTTVLLVLAAGAVLAVLPALVIAGPMLVIEGLRPVDALWRALSLQRHDYWRLLARVICTYVILVTAASIVGLPFTIASMATRPEGDLAMQSLPSLVFGNIGWVLGQIVIMPFLIVTNAQFYADQVARSRLAEPAAG